MSKAPVQGEGLYNPRRFPNSRPPGTISWDEHLKAYEAYAKKQGREQSAEKLAARGGFGYWEITTLLGHEPKTWTPR